MKKPFVKSEGASALLVALIVTGVVASIAATTTMILHKRARQAYQTAAWEEALLASEAGVDMAINELRTTLYDPTNSFQSWHQSTTEKLDGTTTASLGASGAPASGTSSYVTSTVFLRTSSGGQRSWCEVQIDAPASLIDTSTGEQWYRVRSLGIAEVPGGAVVAGDKEDLRLRKFDLAVNRRTGASTGGAPQATRMVEVIIKPMGAFQKALLSAVEIDMNNHNIVVDSYDSRDSTKSTNGFYDPAKRQSHGDIATNGTLISAGTAQIFGTASTNGGTVLGSSNVTGSIRNDFYQELFPVVAPLLKPLAGSPTTATSNTVLAASPGSPSEYLLATVKLSGSNSLHITGAADGSNTFTTIVVSGDISLSGQASIIVDPGVHVRLFSPGSIDITGNGITNPGSPLNFQLYGVGTKDSQNNVLTGSMKIAGNGGLRASVYAPTYNISMVGGGNSDSIFGAFVGLNINMTGVQSVHYDEALANSGLISDYKIVNWFEDTN